MTLTAIAKYHSDKSFRIRDWPEGISWSIKDGIFYLDNKGKISIANVRVVHVTSNDWEIVK